MIYTLTLNPAVDREQTVPTIEFDTVLRATGSRVDCGGKGFNVSRMIKQLGGESVALGLVGGAEGQMLSDELASQGIATDFVSIAENTRTNVSIVSESGKHHLKVNEPGPNISAVELSALEGKVCQLASDGDWWILSGSLPPGVPPSIYGKLISEIQRSGALAILDTSGEAYRLGCNAKPFLITPNLAEVTELTGEAEAIAAVRILQQQNLQAIVTLGSEGALLVDESGVTQATPPSIEPRNPIGAGDALVGGVAFALNQGQPLREAVSIGVACGTVAASLNGTDFGDLKTVEAILSKIQLKEIH
jgi:1-phosphofructokinase family hexose kinase